MSTVSMQEHRQAREVGIAATVRRDQDARAMRVRLNASDPT